MARLLWKCVEASAWKQALESYETSLVFACSLKKTEEGKISLKTLDEWMWGELPQILVDQQYCTREQLVRVTEWKMNRGVWRARNKQLVSSNDEAEVKTLSKEAFSLISECDDEKTLRKAITLLNKLKGVGPATSSALLACYCPEKVPFMSDESMKLIGLPMAYSLKNYISLLSQLKEKQNSLFPADQFKEGEDGVLTLNDLQQALWSSYQMNKENTTSKLVKRTNKEKQPPAKKQKTSK